MQRTPIRRYNTKVQHLPFLTKCDPPLRAFFFPRSTTNPFPKSSHSPGTHIARNPTYISTTKMGCVPSKTSLSESSSRNDRFHSSQYGAGEERGAHKAALDQYQVGLPKRNGGEYQKLGSRSSNRQRSCGGVSGSRALRTQIIDGKVWLY